MIKKEITDKVNQLRYNLCANKGQMIASVHSFTSFTRSLQQSLTFFSYKLSDLLINYLNSSV